MENQEIKNYWKKNNIRKKTLKKNKGKEKKFFIDGPPYATGSIHMGTALNKILKDYYLRYFRMKGYDVLSQPGYDVHGLPIENKVEEELGIKGKQEIEEMGVKKFVDKCKHFAEKHVKEMTEQFKNLGVWMDWENPYVAFQDDYIEGAWHTFKKAEEKGLLYKGKYPVHVCPRCETVVAYNEIEYEKKEDTAVYVKFKLKDSNDYLLIWTTTPWTIPSNTGVMINPEKTYVKVKTMAGNLIMAKKLLPEVMEKLEIGYNVQEEFKGEELVGKEYEHPMDLEIQEKINGKVVPSQRYVELETGTGLVHTAPGHGKEDFEIGQKNDLQLLSPVNFSGEYTEEIGEKYAGMYVKDADPKVMEELRKSRHLMHSEKVTHDYPLCWRCDSPLIFTSIPQWFFKINDIKEDLIKGNKEVNWVPDWAGKRFRDWLGKLSDWPISRQRYWGIPLPIWVCEECGNRKVLGSAEDLDVDELHKPEIDEVTFECEECGGTMKRVPDVLDVWFDAGVAPWASLNYPKEKQPFEEFWPMDFVLEGSDQTRGWWNSLSICGLITMDEMPFKNVVQHGMVKDTKGREMSKSKGNVIDPQEAIDRYNEDQFRFYLVSENIAKDLTWNWKELDEVRKFFNIYKNCVRFKNLYCEEGEMKNLRPEDEWILSRLNTVKKNVFGYTENFKAFKAVQELEEFIVEDVSRWYIKLVRNRTWPSYQGEDKKAAFACLNKVLEETNRLMAPIVPLLSERLYQDKEQKEEESVHLKELPELNESKIDAELEKHMDSAKQIVEASYNAREKAQLKRRWPVKHLVVMTEDKATEKAVERFQELLKKRCNTENILLNKEVPGETTESDFSKGTVEMSAEEITEKAFRRDLLRKIQHLRKKADLDVEDEIDLQLYSEEKKTRKMLEEAQDRVEEKVELGSYSVASIEEPRGRMSYKDKKVKIDF